jgi:histidinol-phosphate aminotransferase
MSDPLRHVKPAVRALKAYTLAARQAPIKINQNENPFELPEAMKRRVLERVLARPWGRYPEFDPRQLTTALAEAAGWRPDGVLAGNGSNEMIEALLLVTVGAGTRVVIPEPTFTLYALLTSILGGEAVRVSLGPDLEYDADAIAQARRQREAPLTIVCSPNNPTGGLLGRDAVARLCAEGDGLVVIDEAYHEFSGQSVVPLLGEHENLVVLRTFSKAMSLAGLRVGYLLAHPDLVREVDKARLPYNINFFSQVAALAALEEKDELGMNVTRLVRMRDALFADLQRMRGIRPYPSRANFILVEIEDGDPRAVFESLYAEGVLVRDVSTYPRLARCLRLTVGTEAENAALLEGLGRALAREKPRPLAATREAK